MATLNRSNTEIDESSGAVLFKRPPELTRLARLGKKVDQLEEQYTEISAKLDRIVGLLEEEHPSGTGK